MRLNVLGPLELVDGDHARPLGPPKQRAVLALLAMHADRVVSVDTLVDALWGDAPPANPLGNLQAYVSHLRRLLEPDRAGRSPSVLVSAADGYGLMTTRLTLDVRELEARLQSARELLARGGAVRVGEAVAEYDAALGLWRGDPYADVRNDEWAAPEIARIDELRLTAQEERAAALLAAGRPAEVITAMEAVTRAHPLRETAWELLASAYAHASRQGEALAALRRIRELLAEELGLDPSPRLRRLEEAVLRQEVGPATTGTTAPTATTVTPTTSARSPRQRLFVGRQDELRQLHEALADSSDELVVQLVDGEPGVGKSTLVEQLTGHVDRPVLWGRSPDHETAPALWPWEQVLGRLAEVRPDLTVPESVAGLLGGETAATPAYDAQGARLRLFDDASRYVAAAAPVCVVLEDIHAADLASLGLLAHLAGIDAPGVLVVATFRRHEASTLTTILARLSRLGARRLSLDGLGVADVRALVTAATGHDPGEEQAAALQDRTAGNPFYLSELVRADSPVPVAVRDVVLARVAALGEHTRSVLEAAAVVGDEAEAWLVAEVAGRPLADTVEALDVAEAAGLVQRARQGLGIRFTHALVVDALLEGRSGLWRAAAAERCAAALTRTRGHLEEQHGAIARHWLAAAELGPDQARSAAEFCARAARSAMNRHAPEDAIQLWQEAVAAGSLGHLRPGETFEHRVGLAVALHSAGRYADGYAAVVDALQDAEGDPHRVVRAADVCMAHGIWVPFQQGMDPVEVRTALDAALPDLPAGSASWALGQACRTIILATTGGEASIDRVSQEAVAAAREQGDPALLRRVLHLRLVAMRGPDFVEQRASTARAIKELPGVPAALEVIADIHLASHLVELGRVDEARTMLRDLEVRAAATHDPTLIRQLASMRVGLLVFEGRHDEATAMLDSLEEATTTLDAAYFQVAEIGQRLLTALEQDRLEENEPLIEAIYSFSGASAFGYALGLSLAGRGEIDRAGELLTANPMPHRDYLWVGTIITRLLLAMAVGADAIVEECRAQMLPFAGQLMVSGTCTTIYGAWDGQLGEAALALGERTTAARQLAAAVDLLERNGAGPYWLGRATQALSKCT